MLKDKKMMTLQEFAKATGMPKSAVSECLCDPRFPRFRSGHRILIPYWLGIEFIETASLNWYEYFDD